MGLMVKKTFTRALYLSIFAISAAFFPIACGGGGGGGGGGGSGGATKVILTGTVDSHVTTQNGASSNPVPNAVVHIVDPSGNQITTTTDASGHYTAQVTKLTDYGVSVDMPSSKPGTRSVSDPVTMRGILFVGGSDSSLDVNPGSTAAVIVLMKIFNITIGVPGVGFGSALGNVDIGAFLTTIYNAAGFPALADLVSLDIANHVDPFTDPAVLALAQAIVNALTATTLPIQVLNSEVLDIEGLGCSFSQGYYNKAEVGWTIISGVDGYELYFGTSPTPTISSNTIIAYMNPATIVSGLLPFSGNLAPNVTYYFAVRGINGVTKPENLDRAVDSFSSSTFGPWSEVMKFNSGSGKFTTDDGTYPCARSFVF